MGIRLKLFIPTLILLLMLSLLIHFVWLPNNLAVEEKFNIDNEIFAIELLSTALIPRILTNDIADIHSTLNRVLKDRSYWRAITLHKNNVRLYPVSENKISTVNHLKLIEYEILHEGNELGVIKLWIDLNELMERNVDRMNRLEELLLVLIILASIVSTIILERWIISPLEKLLSFAKELSDGNYGSELDYKSHDEIGELVNSLVNMRDEIKSREEDIKQVNNKLLIANVELEHLSNTDAVTNVSNRRYFDEVLAKEINKCTRQDIPITLIICDIDYFKKFNDSYGHHKGDECLAKVALAIKNTFTRVDDVVARYGGEEFAVILPNTDKDQALSMAKEMSENVNKLNILHESSDVSDSVTISIGLTSGLLQKNTTMSILIERADKALYAAKDAGRNTIRFN